MAFTTFDNYVGYVSTTGTQPQLDALDKLISQEKAWDPSTTEIMNMWGNLAWDKDLDPKIQGPAYITYGNALNALKTYPQKLDYLTSLYNVSDAKIKDDFAKSAGKYLYDTNPPGLTGAEKQAYTPANYTDIVTGKATGPLKKNILDARVEAGKQAILNSTPYSNGLNDSQLTAKATALVNGTPTSSMADFNTFKDSYLDAVGRPSYTPTADWNKNLSKLKTDYGSLIDPTTGKAKFSESYLTDVAKGIAPADDFNKTINSLVNDAVRVSNPSLFAKGVQPNLQGSEYVAVRNALLKTPASLTSSYNTNVVGATKDPKTNTWATPSKNTDIDTPSGTPSDTSTNFAYDGGISNLLGSNGQIDPTKLKNMLSSYDSNAGTYRSPTVQNGRATFDSSTPYSSLLNSLLTTTNPFASDYKSSVALPSAMSDSQLTAIKKTANVNTTPADLLKLANTAGQTYDPKAVTSLSPALTQMYQPSTTNSAGQPAKPGAPDLTKTTIPTLTSDGTGIINSNGTVTKIDNTNTIPKDWWYTRGFASEAQANANGWFNDVKKVSDDPGKVVDPGIVKPLVKTPAELAAEKFALDKASYMNSFTARDYIDPQNRTRSDILTQAKTDPKLAANLDWSAQLDKSPADFTSKVGMTPAEIAAADKIEADRQAGLVALANQQAAEKAAIASQANLEASAQNAGYQGDLSDTGAMQGYINSQNTSVQDYTGNYAKQQAIDKAEADRQAGLVALANQQAAEKAAIANTLFQQGNITAMPTGVAATGSNVFEKPPSTGGINETVSLPTNTVVQAVNPTSSNQTVALPTSATVGPITAVQRDLGPLNISNLGAVISPQAMNSTAGGVASLVGPQVTVQPQPAVTQQPAAVTQQPVGVSGNTSSLFTPPDTRVFDTAGNVVAGKRKLFV